MTTNLSLRIAPVIPLLAIVFAGCPSTPPPAPNLQPPATVVSFSASPTQVGPGDSATLSWEVENAREISIRHLSGDVVPLDEPGRARGSVTVAIDASTTFVLTAFGEHGNDSGAARVVVAKAQHEPLFGAFPLQVAAGSTTTLAWDVPAGPVTITDGGGATVHQSDKSYGSIVVQPQQDTTYTLNAGSQSYTVDVVVTAAIHVFTSNVKAAAPGGEVTLLWSVGGASSVTLSSDGRGELVTVTDSGEMLDGSWVDHLPTSLPSQDAVVRYTLTAVRGDQVLVRELLVWSGTDPRLDAFSIAPYVLEGVSIPVSWNTTGATRLELTVDGARYFVASSQAQVDEHALVLPGITEAMTVTIDLWNERGGKITETRTVATVGVPTTGTLTASPTSIAQAGTPVTLGWNVPNARHVRIVAKNGPMVFDFVGDAAEAGSTTVYPNAHTEYVLIADNTVGNALPFTPTAQVTVDAPARLVFDPPIAQANSVVQVTGHTVPNGGTLIGLPGSVAVDDGQHAFVDISATGTPTNYSGPGLTTRKVTMPQYFATRVFGVPVYTNEIHVNINGWMTFAPSSNVFNAFPVTLPTTSLEPLTIAPYADDLIDNAGSDIFYELQVVGGERRLVVQWDKVEHDDFTGSMFTFQAQIYESGKIVFAYKDFNGLPNDTAAIGVVNVNRTTAEVAPTVPSAGTTFTFFTGGALPAPFVTTAGAPISLRLQMPTGGFIDLDDSPLAAVVISELNLNPGVGVADGQWVELHNRTNSPIDLTGWTLSLGANGTHTFAAGPPLPPDGYFVLGQSAGAGDGVTVDALLAPGMTIPSTGTLTLSSPAFGISSLVLPSYPVPQGVTWQQGRLPPGLTTVAGVKWLECTAQATSTYGANGQKGTPGLPNTPCPKYVAPVSIAGAFEPIAATGTQLTFVDLDDDVAQVQPPVPFLLDGIQVPAISVSTNGYIVPGVFTCPQYCYSTNKTSLNPSTAPAGVIAPFWDDVDTTSKGGVYWERKSGYTIVSWEGVHRFDHPADTLEFQVKFFDTGNIEFHYGTISAAVLDSVTTWFEHPSGLAAFIVNVNNAAGVVPNSGHRLAAQ